MHTQLHVRRRVFMNREVRSLTSNGLRISVHGLAQVQNGSGGYPTKEYLLFSADDDEAFVIISGLLASQTPPNAISLSAAAGKASRSEGRSANLAPRAMIRYRG